MWSFLSDTFRETLHGFGMRLQELGPGLLAMLLTFVLGMLAAALVRLALRALLPRVGFDRFAAGLGVTLLLERGGVTRPPAQVAASLAAWAVVIVSTLLAISMLKVQVASDLVARAFAYLPQVLVAGAVLLLGMLASAFARRSILIAAVNAGLASGRLLATGAEIFVMALSIAMALEHVGVGREIIVASFTILFGGVVFALALAFGLAGRKLARQVLEEVAGGGRQSPDSARHL